MAKPDKEELVLVVHRIIHDKDIVETNYIHRSNAYGLYGLSDKFGPIPYGLLNKKRTKLCRHCYPPSDG